MIFQSKIQNLTMHPGIFLFSATILSNVNYYYNPFELSQEQLDSISYSVSTANAVYSLYNFFEMKAMKTAFSFEKSKLIKSFLVDKDKLFNKLNQDIHNIFIKMITKPESLKDIINPNFWEQLFAIYESPEAIKYIKKPTQIIKEFAMSIDIETIQWIKNLNMEEKYKAMLELTKQGYNIANWIKFF